MMWISCAKENPPKVIPGYPQLAHSLADIDTDLSTYTKRMSL